MKKNSFTRIITVTCLSILFTLALSQSGNSLDLPGDELNTLAANTCAASVCTTVQVNLMVVHTNGNIYFDTSGIETGLTCTPFQNRYLQIEPTQTNFKEMYTALLAQQLSNKTISVRVEATGPCKVMFLTVVRSS